LELDLSDNEEDVDEE